ncbi:MAG: sodium:calcium antiporter [Parasphingopyxis sp.]|uniref:sodium:calcium antiporter n=1 Tax=Parasphingopyxis sp. TaxID=1920299 RepID=UPI0032ED5DF5
MWSRPVPDLAALDPSATLLVFGGAALLIALLGARMANLADVIADRTGLGEALVGAVLLGAGTSIAGIVTSVSTASTGHPALSVSNAIGGIAAQTAFLAIADIFYRRVNLEHAAASAVNLTQATVLIGMMAVPLIAWAGPDYSLFGVHPATPILVGVYLIGLHNAHRQHERPMWQPLRTDQTRKDEPDDTSQYGSSWRVGGQFAALVIAVGLCGYVVGETGIAIAGDYGISESVVGGLLTAVATSLPELVTTIAAVRVGAPQLAFGGIIGGNMFDALFISASDVAYRNGSIYHAISEREIFWYGLTIVMTAVLLTGMLRRERQGPAGIGWESTLLLGLYTGGAALQISMG